MHGMRKNMYSLILAEEVVREIDRLAQASGKNRSSYVNEILAEHCAYLTPEKRIRSILGAMEDLMDAAFETTPSEKDCTLSARSTLDYKYRPAMNYSVELYRTFGGSLGELRVQSRSQSEELLRGLKRFFRLMAEMEKLYLSKYFRDKEIQFEISDGKLTRIFRLPQGADERELSEAVSSYVNLFDRLLKGFISGEIGSREMENEYVKYLNANRIII